jgi:NAD(P)-dependent dehydrogenase (short-subunit alcohol dehydrogenase family)
MKGKDMEICLITGTSTGIGRATALHLARNGYRVYASMRNTAKGEALAASAAEEGLPLSVKQLDVTDGESMAAAVAEIEASEGRIDVLINNAGLGGAAAAEEMPEDEHRRLFETNYFGLVNLTQSVLPGMRTRGHGAIVNISSLLGRIAVVNQSAYCATKFAVEAFSESMALEVSRFGVRVILVEPGVIATEIFDNTPQHFEKTSPYVESMRQGGRLYRAAFQAPTPAGTIAETIHEALTTTSPKLRWLAGFGSEIVTRRGEISDEDYIAMAALDEPAYDAAYQDAFGIDLRKKP